MSDPAEPVQLDLNNPVFQRQWFALPKEAQWSVLGILRKLAGNDTPWAAWRATLQFPHHSGLSGPGIS